MRGPTLPASIQQPRPTQKSEMKRQGNLDRNNIDISLANNQSTEKLSEQGNAGGWMDIINIQNPTTFLHIWKTQMYYF